MRPVSALPAYLVSAALHAAVLIWLVGVASSGVGGGGEMLEGISVELIRSASIDSESPVEQPATSPPPSSATGNEMSPSDVESEAVAEARAALQEEKVKLPEPEAADLAKHETSPDGTMAMQKEPPPVSHHDRSKEPRPVRREANQAAQQISGKDKQDREAIAESRRGAAMTGSSSATIAAPAAAGASAGELARYALQVRKVLARHQPKHIALRGRVMIGFGIRSSGAVSYVEVVRSSGHAKLDQSAVAAIRSISFPPPPAGMTPKQLSYNIPIEFQ